MSQSTTAGTTDLDTREGRVRAFGTFLRQYAKDDVAQLAQRYPNEQRSLWIDYTDLFRFDHELAERIRDHPDPAFTEFEDALTRYDLPIDAELADASIRITNLHDRVHVSSLQRKHRINTLNGFEGQVTKVTPVKEKAHVIPFECQRCGTITRIPQNGDSLQQPHECHGCERKGPFHYGHDEEIKQEMTDHQLVRIQEPPDETKGAQGRTIDVALDDDLIDVAQPGDRVRGSGILELITDTDDSCVFDTMLSANHLETEETDFGDIDTSDYEEDIRAIANGDRGDPFELLVDSIAPSHYGGEPIKRAIGLQLFGGVSRDQPDGSYQRGDSHILLLGDPGSGKSSFLQTVRSIAPRASYVSGKGASAAGLTAAAVSDDFGDASWSLEAGALVLADGGVACVDEIDKMGEDAVKSMHEALEAQEVHISKAGINAKLSARSALLAAGNPRDGRFDPYEDNMGKQIDLDPALVNRFDLIFLVDDNPDYEQDRGTAMHIIRRRRDPQEPAVEADLLRAWVAYAKQHCDPTFESEETEARVAEWYATFRKQGAPEGAPIPMNARNLQAVVRLAEASARVRLSETVNESDVKRAIDMVEASLKQVGYDEETGMFDSDMLETGQSMAQRERMRTIRSILRSEEAIPSEDLVDVATKEGITKEQTLAAIKKLKNQGDVYAFGDGEGLRLTEDV